MAPAQLAAHAGAGRQHRRRESHSCASRSLRLDSTVGPEGFPRRFMPRLRPSICAASSFQIPGTCRKKMRGFITGTRSRNTTPPCRSIRSRKLKSSSISVRCRLKRTRSLRPSLVRFVPAAHILGSAMVELTLRLNGQTRKLLFSGDIGRVRDQVSAPGKVVRSGPTEGESADILVMESTYGNREHPTDDPRPKLAAAIIRQTVQRGGWVVAGRICGRTHPEIPVHAQGTDGIGANSAHSGVLRQPHGHQSGRSFPETLGRVQRRDLPPTRQNDVYRSAGF